EEDGGGVREQHPAQAGRVQPDGGGGDRGEKGDRGGAGVAADDEGVAPRAVVEFTGSPRKRESARQVQARKVVFESLEQHSLDRTDPAAKMRTQVRPLTPAPLGPFNTGSV